MRQKRIPSLSTVSVASLTPFVFVSFQPFCFFIAFLFSLSFSLSFSLFVSFQPIFQQFFFALLFLFSLRFHFLLFSFQLFFSLSLSLSLQHLFNLFSLSCSLSFQPFCFLLAFVSTSCIYRLFIYISPLHCLGFIFLYFLSISAFGRSLQASH